MKISDKRIQEALHWLVKQDELVWLAAYDNRNDRVVAFLEDNGLIERVRRPKLLGKTWFRGGFRITPAGRNALDKERGE